jgi:hypothetical protein
MECYGVLRVHTCLLDRGEEQIYSTNMFWNTAYMRIELLNSGVPGNRGLGVLRGRHILRCALVNGNNTQHNTRDLLVTGND